MIKNPLTYEVMTPQSIGVPGTGLILGKHPGRHALGLRCEQLGFQLDRHGLDLIYRRFLVLADNIKAVEDHQILDLIGEIASASKPSDTCANDPVGQVLTDPALIPHPTNT